MSEDRVFSKSENVGLEDLQTEFLNLRIGEEVPRLQISQIRRVINETKQDNLPGVDYKYIIETKDKKVLKVNSWILWKKIAAVLREAGKIDVDLELRHTGMEEYSVRIV
jgi:tRNA A37 threonylcarbamoyladenosine dehydratase